MTQDEIAAERLKEFMARKGFNKVSFARWLGIERKSVHRWCNGQLIGTKALVTLARKTGISCDWWLGLSGGLTDAGQGSDLCKLKRDNLDQADTIAKLEEENADLKWCLRMLWAAQFACMNPDDKTQVNALMRKHGIEVYP